METTTAIRIRKTTRSNISEVDFENLEFGKYTADHMLVCDYMGNEWKTPQILPFANLSLSPATLALHYGQTVFEGMKAFRMEDGRINVFRMEKHYERFIRSLERMCMAVLPKEIFVDGILQLVETDKAWVPAAAGAALYLRPFMFASEARFGVKVSSEYRFIIFTGPVPTLYTSPIKVKVETEFVRAAPGGTGTAKCGGNYGGAFYPTQLARNEGYDQVLWTDATQNIFIEESGMMNVMFVIDGKLVTPPLSDTLLDGVTRDSLLTIARDMGIETEERPVRVDELNDAFLTGRITEAFGAGTAAVVAPIGTINIHGKDQVFLPYTKDNIMYSLKERLDAIRLGGVGDKWGWNS
jgi:branched-chain amino acid aminotransferase